MLAWAQMMLRDETSDGSIEDINNGHCTLLRGAIVGIGLTDLLLVLVSRRDYSSLG